jgi:hypothetical protein
LQRMAYARLDVYWDDGRLDSYLLTTDTVSVGRAPSNTIPLDTDTISRYHFSIVRDEDIVTLTDLDSANGTYIDGIQLVSNQPHVLAGVEEIQIGQLRIIYNMLDDQPTLPMAPLDDSTQRIAPPSADFRLELDATSLDVWPASSSNAELSITNTSDDDMNFEIGVDGMPAKWVRVNRGRLFVPAGETSRILINIKTPRRPDVQPITYQANIQVQPDDTTANMLEVPLKVNIMTYRGFGIALAQPVLDSGETGRLYLHNQGNTPLTLNLRGHSPNGEIRLQFSQTTVTLDAGQRHQVNVTPHARQRPLTGNEQLHRFDVHVHSQDEAHFLVVETGKAIVKPLLPAWALISVTGIAISVVLILLLGLAGILAPAPEPNVANFAVNTTQIAQGDSLTLSWDVSDVAAIDVYADGLRVTTLEGDATSYDLDTSNYSGDIDVEIVGTRGNDEVRQSASVFVYIPMNVASFTVSPSPLVRHVVTAIDVSWDVPGAVLTRISGLDDFTTSLYESEHTDSATLQGIGGVADTALTLSLYAEDEAGNILEETLVVDVVDASCTADSDVTLHEGPAELYQQVGTVPQGQSIIVQAQDASSGWLQTTLAGGTVAWGERSAFTCADNFDPDQLRKAFNVPPTPTPIPPTFTPPPPTLEPTKEPTQTQVPKFTPTPVATGARAG